MLLKYSLQKHETIFRWLSENPGNTKENAYTALGLKPDAYDCPCYAYVLKVTDDMSIIRNRHCSFNCPIRSIWPIYGTANTCMLPGSIYLKWLKLLKEEQTAENIDAQIDITITIADTCLAELNKL